MSSEANTQQQPTEDQIVEARFEAVKVVTAVAERVLLNPYERQIIIQACALALQGLQAEYARITGSGDNSEDEPQVEAEEEGIDISFEEESADSEEAEEVEEPEESEEPAVSNESEDVE